MAATVQELVGNWCNWYPKPPYMIIPHQQNRSESIPWTLATPTGESKPRLPTPCDVKLRAVYPKIRTHPTKK